MKYIFIAVACLCVTIAGCGEAMYRVSGRPFDTSYAQRILRGKTTKEEVRRALGEPMATAKTIMGGREVDTWPYEYVKQKEGFGQVLMGAMDSRYRLVEKSRLDINFQRDVVLEFSETGKPQ